MTSAQVLRLRATNAEVIRYPNGPTAYSLVGRSIGLMSGLRKCNAAMMTTKYAVPTIATVAKTASGSPACRSRFLRASADAVLGSPFCPDPARDRSTSAAFSPDIPAPSVDVTLSIVRERAGGD
jgi:hypothetical protein